MFPYTREINSELEKKEIYNINISENKSTLQTNS